MDLKKLIASFLLAFSLIVPVMTQAYGGYVYVKYTMDRKTYDSNKEFSVFVYSLKDETHMPNYYCGKDNTDYAPENIFEGKNFVKCMPSVSSTTVSWSVAIHRSEITNWLGSGKKWGFGVVSGRKNSDGIRYYWKGNITDFTGNKDGETKKVAINYDKVTGDVKFFDTNIKVPTTTQPSNPSTPPDYVPSPLIVQHITGVLKHITGNNLPADERIWYIAPSSGDNLNLGTSYGRADWDKTPPEVGATYTCSFYGGPDDPVGNINCKKGTTAPADPDRTITSDPTGGGDTTSQPEEKPLEFVTTAVEKKPLPSILGAGCPEDESGKQLSTYTSGILTGIPCTGAVKDLKSVTIIIKNLITVILLPLIGIIFTIMIIVGGLMYITSAGNEERVKKAKQTLTTAIIGLLIVIFANVIIGVFSKFLGGGLIKW